MFHLCKENVENIQENNKQYNVLIVDDNDVNLLLANSIINQLLPNSEIIEAHNGIQAIEKFKTKKPDIIFMDLQMPEMNGYDATQKIRQIETNTRTPIIALTAGDVMEEFDMCMKAGMDDFISKPVVKNTIQKAIHNWLFKNK